MKTITRTGLVTLVFAAGCAASRFVVPPATAQNQQRWDYFCFQEGSADEVTAKAKSAGNQGWELVAASGRVLDKIWCFKRPL